MPAIPSQCSSRRVSLAELFFPDSMVSRPEAEEVRAGSAKELGTAEGKGGKQRGLDRSRLLVIGLLAVANFFATVSFSCIVPFFPTEAIQQKEQSTTQVGLVIGWFQLIQFLASPVIGKNMGLLRPNRAFSGGILLSGISAIIFGLANWLPPGNAFFVGTLLVRTAQAVGSAAFATGTFSLVGRFLPNQIGLITAINEVAYGLGFTLGPPLGSVLFEAGGYLLPCLVVGSAQVALVFLSLPLHWGPLAQSDLDQEAATTEAAGKLPAPGIFQLLCIPDVFMPLLSLFVLCIAWVFYEPDLAHHLSSFAGQWSPSMMVGLMMTLHSSAYLITAPIWGYLLDRHFGQRTTAVILIGGSLTLLYALLVGPSPLLPLPKSLPLFGFSFTLIGIAGAILYIPVFKWCVEAAKEHGFDEKSPAVCGLVSGFFQSTVSLGAFLGTTLGGWSSEKFGFAWTATGVAALELFQMTLQVLYYFVKKRRQNRSNKVRNMEAQKGDHNHNVWK